MANANQIIINGETKIDLTNDTVTPATLAAGATAHDASGAVITGEAEIMPDVIPISRGGTEATTATDARRNLGLSTAVIEASISGKTITLTFADGSIQTLTTQDTTYSAMTAATSSAAGKAGLVPAPAAGAQAKFLRGDATWQSVTSSPFTARATSIGDASTTKPAVVVSSYRNGNDWYRVWSDGWVEQGGLLTTTGSGKTITLHKAMADTKCVCHCFYVVNP